MISSSRVVPFVTSLRSLAVFAAGSLPLTAGDGKVNNDGTIDIRVNLRFPPTAADLTEVRQQISDASAILWDASEGQLRFGTVTLDCGAVNEDLADLWAFAESGRAGVSFRCDGSALSVRGRHVSLFVPSSDAEVVAHEFGHLALGLGDEYNEQSRFGACWGYGPCFDAAATAQGHCLMQQNGGPSTELCVAANHDPLRGEGTPCTTGAAPCADNCDLFDPASARYATTQQEDVCGGDCWTHLASNFSFLTAPTGLPNAAAPAGFVGPTFVENCGASDTVLLVLDRSGSMLWNTKSDGGEVCGNGADDDGDGSVDESGDCTQSRLQFVKAAARAWLALAAGQSVRAGVVSFNQLASLDATFQDVNSTTLPTLNARVDSLTAGGSTAIGRALTSTSLLFGAESGVSKTAFLISDGVNTEGEAPQSVVPALQAQGIRVFAISTGEASDDGTLSEISGATGGALVDSRDTSELVNAFAQQWARYRNDGVAVPRLAFELNTRGRKPTVEDVRRDAAEAWRTDADIALGAVRAAQTSSFTVRFEAGTTLASVVLAGDLGDMATFGVEARLTGPAGAGPTSFDSATPVVGQRVVRDSHFLLIEVRDPNPGEWTVEIRGRAGAAPVQSGNATVLVQNPSADLFTAIDRRVVPGPAQPVRVDATPIFRTPLVAYGALLANVRRPDGSLAPLALSPAEGDGPSGLYGDMPFRGLYEARVTSRSGGAAANDPGEALFASAPSASVPVPDFERTSSEFFFVASGRLPCPSGDPRDCDGDGVREESETNDADNDGRPDAYDTDSDNDDVPDAVEHRDRDQDPDRDGRPNALDPDSDGDGLNDGVDPTRTGATQSGDGARCPPWMIALLVLLALALLGALWQLRKPWPRVLCALLLLVVLVALWRCLF